MLEKIRTLVTNPLILFFLKSSFLFLLWIIVYDFWINPAQTFDLFVIDQLLTQGRFILELLGYELIPDAVYDTDYRTLGLDGTHGVWVGDPCNGITIFALFVGFIVAYPGKLLQKLWFIPFGIITIHLLNVIRIAALCIILLEAPDKLEFNHTYVFTTIIYSYIFLLWYWWSNKLSNA